MNVFLALLLIAAMIATVVALVRGIIVFLKTTEADLNGTGPSVPGLRSNKMMQARVFWLRCLQFWRDSVGDDLAAAAVCGLPRYGSDVQGVHGRAAPDAAG